METLSSDLASALGRREAERLVRIWIDENTAASELNVALSGGFAFFYRPRQVSPSGIEGRRRSSTSDTVETWPGGKALGRA